MLEFSLNKMSNEPFLRVIAARERRQVRLSLPALELSLAHDPQADLQTSLLETTWPGRRQELKRIAWLKLT